jgi:hypothetical protein
MALARTVYAWETAKPLNGSGAVTTTSRTYNSGELVCVDYCAADNLGAGTLSISNSGTAQTWNLIAVTNTGSNVKVAAWQCKMSVTQAMTITATGNGGGDIEGAIKVVVHTGQHATDPVPAGNVFSGTGGTDVSQAITPTSSGSCLYLVAGDWSATDTYAAIANCTLQEKHQNATDQTVALFEPITQPRPDTSAFTIGETDTAGKIAWIAYEVQAAPEPSTINVTPGAWAWTGSISTVIRDPETAFQQNAFQSNAFQIYGGSTGAGPNTVNATPGTWSWAGSSSPLAVQQINQVIGTWSWAGTTATIPTMIAATPGTWSWAGSNSPLSVQQISQTTGAWSWTGSNSPPAVQQINQVIGTWTWAGSTATIDVQQINQIQGTWSWSGTTQTITTPGGATEINAAIGTWTWAGAQATLEVPQINQTTGTFSWAGSTQTFSQLIDATPGTWTWAGTIQGIVGAITVQQDLGAGGVAKRKYRKRFVVEVDGELFEVRSEQEAVNVLEQLVELAKKQAEVTVERAQKANKRPKRKVLSDARKSLVIPKVEANRWLSDMADQAMIRIEEIYEDALRIIEIGALLKKRDDDDEDEIETILLML